MVVPLIFGKIAKDLLSGDLNFSTSSFGYLSVGFLAAFFSGLFACQWMISLVKKSKVILLLHLLCCCWRNCYNCITSLIDMMTGDQFKDGQVLLIDKPLNWTSFQVVNKLRWEIRNRFNFKKLK